MVLTIFMPIKLVPGNKKAKEMCINTDFRDRFLVRFVVDIWVKEGRRTASSWNGFKDYP